MAVVIMCVGIGLFATFASACGIFMHSQTSRPVPPSDTTSVVDQNNRVLSRLDELEEQLKKIHEDAPEMGLHGAPASRRGHIRYFY